MRDKSLELNTFIIFHLGFIWESLIKNIIRINVRKVNMGTNINVSYIYQILFIAII